MPNKNRTSLTGALTFLVSARLVLNTGYRFIYPFLPVIARGLGIPLTQAGLLVSARWITGLATPAAVRIIGRGERRHRLIVAGLAMFATGAVVTAATGVFAGALVGFVLLGLGKPTFDVAAQAYLSDRTPYPVRARYLGVIELTWAGSLL
ncbi:MAG: MFS transporter, partial [Acidimicrobiia bacterium]|nr:MFS transporter [Acidimicrobiia bacterium]